jgi:hypothetical protein
VKRGITPAWKNSSTATRKPPPSTFQKCIATKQKDYVEYGLAQSEVKALGKWDGMRPDFVSEKTTPNLWKLSQEGVTFTRHHPCLPELDGGQRHRDGHGRLPGA